VVHGQVRFPQQVVGPLSRGDTQRDADADIRCDLAAVHIDRCTQDDHQPVRHCHGLGRIGHLL